MASRVAARHRKSAKPVPYKEGDLVEIHTRGYPQVVKVEDKIQIKGKPGFIGRDEDTGAVVRDFDESIRRTRRKDNEPLSDPNLPEGLNTVQWEILNQRIDGVPVHEEISKYVRTIIARGQEVHNLVKKARKYYEDHVEQGPRPMSDADLEKAIYKLVVYPRWGNDPMGKLIAHAVATGDYLF